MSCHPQRARQSPTVAVVTGTGRIGSACYEHAAQFHMGIYHALPEHCCATGVDGVDLSALVQKPHHRLCVANTRGGHDFIWYNHLGLAPRPRPTRRALRREARLCVASLARDGAAPVLERWLRKRCRRWRVPPGSQALYEAYSSTQKEAQRPPNPKLRKRPCLVRFLQRIIDRGPVDTSRSRLLQCARGQNKLQRRSMQRRQRPEAIAISPKTSCFRTVECRLKSCWRNAQI